jgi:hypothetical protein
MVPLSFIEIPQTVCPVKAGQDSIHNPCGYFDKPRRTCRQYAQLGLVVISAVKFGCNPLKNLTCVALSSSMPTDVRTDRRTDRRQGQK